MDRSYIYCITNPCMKDICKVGLTSKTLSDRLKGLNNTSVASCFKLEYYIEVNSDERFKIEKNIHNDIVTNGYDRMPGREFFKCNPCDIIKLFEKYGVVKYEEEVNENVMVGGKKENIIVREVDNKESNINMIIKDHKCPHCNKSFKYNKKLQIHIILECHVIKNKEKEKMIINKLNDIFQNKIKTVTIEIKNIIGEQYENNLINELKDICIYKSDFIDIAEIIESVIKNNIYKIIIDNNCSYCSQSFLNRLSIENHIKLDCKIKQILDYNIEIVIIQIQNMINEYNRILYLKKYSTNII